MTTELDRRPVPCRARFCTRSVPKNQAVPASKVLGRDNARGWFCPQCAANGGTRVMTGSSYVLPDWARPRCGDVKVEQLRGTLHCELPESHPGLHLSMQDRPIFW